jgi:hypothetical protein
MKHVPPPDPCQTLEEFERYINGLIDKNVEARDIVATFNHRKGKVTFLPADLLSVGGAFTLSPAFTGTPTAPTAPVGTNTNQLATTAFVMANVAASVVGVNTWNSRSGNVVLLDTDISAIPDLDFTGVPTAPTAVAGTATTQLATTEFVTDAIAAADVGVSSFNGRTGAVVLVANDISALTGLTFDNVDLTGVPTAPTAASGTASDQLATTQFVADAIASVSAGVTTFNGRSGVVALTAADVTSAGNILVQPPGGGDPDIVLNKPASGTTADIIGKTNNVNRWILRLGNETAESGSNAGSDFVIYRCNDAGAAIDTTFWIGRSDGAVHIPNTVDCSSTVSANYLYGNSGSVSGSWSANGVYTNDFASYGNASVSGTMTATYGNITNTLWVNNISVSGNFSAANIYAGSWLYSYGNLQVNGSGYVYGTGISYGDGHFFRFTWSGSAPIVTIDNAVSMYFGGPGASDVRLKEDIVASKLDCLDAVLKMNVYQFKWKARDGIIPAGLVAQELYKTSPSCVLKGEGTTYWSIDANNLLATLVGAVQQLAKEKRKAK